MLLKILKDYKQELIIFEQAFLILCLDEFYPMLESEKLKNSLTNMKKTPSKKPGSVKSLPTSKMSKSQINGNRSTKHNSELKVQNVETRMVDSPYKHSLNEIKQVAPKRDDSDDFRTPPIIKKTKCTNLQISKNKKTNSKKSIQTISQNSILKRTKDNFVNLDVNPEHLQMALALSKSTFEMGNPQNCQIDEDLPISLKSPNHARQGSVLERFGFKTDRHKVNLVDESCFNKNAKKRKNTKFRYVTPTLLTRINEDREALITTKMSFILRHIDSAISTYVEQAEFEIFSEIIKERYFPESKIISLNSVDQNNLQKDIYLVKKLDLPISKSYCGCLLKNWEEIPGRDASPNRLSHREIETDLGIKPNSTDNTSEASECFLKRNDICVSPDLFDTDSEMDFQSTNENETFNTTKFNQSNRSLKKLYKSDSGIEHFESVCEDSLPVSQQINKLMKKYLISEASNESRYFNNCIVIPDTTGVEGNGDVQSVLSYIKKSSDSISNCSQGLQEVIKSDKSIVDDSFSESSHSNSIELQKENCSSANMLDHKFQENNNLHESNFNVQNDTDLPLTHLNIENDDLTRKMESDYNKINYGNEKERINSDEEATDLSKITTGVESKCFPHENSEIANLYKRRSEHNIKEGSYRESFNNTDNLDITNYVNELLNGSVYNKEENESKQSTTEDIRDIPDNLSQSSSSKESIIINDEELNYSNMKSSETKGEHFYNLCSTDEEELEEIESNNAEDIEEVHLSLKAKYSQDVSSPSSEERPEELRDIPKNTEASPPKKNNGHPISTIALSTNMVDTPKSNLKIKTKDVTPMTNYEEMNSPQIRAELDKFGLKPLKRRRGIQLLKYIYECTHPIIDTEEDGNTTGNAGIVKRRKIEGIKNGRDNTSHLDYSQNSSRIDIVGDLLLQNEKDADLIFEKKTSRNVLSCRIPLQIVWYNFVSSNPELHKSILLYEPLHLDIIHSMLKEQSGCKFKLEDVINFLDKKCITFRMSQGQRHKKKE